MQKLEHRIRTIIKREQITRERFAEYANVSSQAVQKWISKGQISDSKAKEVASKFGVDWLWLKHGVCRMPLDVVQQIIVQSNRNMVLARWDTLGIVACGEIDNDLIAYSNEELIGKTLDDLAVNYSKSDFRRAQKLVILLGHYLEPSYRMNFKDKNSIISLKITQKGYVTDSSGITYGFDKIESVEPNGTEGSILSLKFENPTALNLPAEEIERIEKQFPDIPHLHRLLCK